MTNYGIAIFPSKKLQDKANSYRKRYDPNYSLIPPHITIKQSFTIEEEAVVKEVIAEIKKIAAQVPPFPIHVLRVSSFAPVNNVIYLKIELVEELQKLHDVFHSGYFNDEREYAYVPHITLGQSLSNDEYSDVFGRLRMVDLEHEEIVDRIHLLYQLENGSWTVYETFLLGGQTN